MEFYISRTFLCEYYLATGDKKVLKTINYINDTLALEATSENGRHAHRITTEGGYGGGGINVITGHVYLFWTLAKKCGIKIHQKPYSAVLDHLIKVHQADVWHGLYVNSKCEGCQCQKRPVYSWLTFIW